jgi:hypothetical protein
MEEKSCSAFSEDRGWKGKHELLSLCALGKTGAGRAAGTCCSRNCSFFCWSLNLSTLITSWPPCCAAGVQSGGVNPKLHLQTGNNLAVSHSAAESVARKVGGGRREACRAWLKSTATTELHIISMQHKWIRFNSMQMANLLLRCILVPRCNRAAGVSEYLEV